MEDQSPYVTSSSYVKEDAEDQHRGPEEAKPWDIDDVLDLTGGAGQLSHPTFSVSFPGKEAAPAAEEDDEEEKGSYLDSLEPSPEDEEPSNIGSDLPGATVIPSAPEEEHDRPAAPHSAPARPRSADVNLFPIPASSAPLMHSSSDLVMDFQRPPSTAPAGQEELSSLLLESTTSLHSLSPLSADSSKEQLVAFPADSTTPEAFNDPIREEHAASRTIDDSPIVEKLASGLEYSFPQATDHKGTSSVAQEKLEDLFFSEKGYAVEHPTSVPESSPGDHTKLYTQSAKEMFSGMLKSVEPPHEEFSDLKEGPDEQYVDFKPFASTWDYGGDFEPRDVSVDLKSNVTKSLFESKLEEKYDDEKDVDVSDDISPASPEATSDSPNYDMFAPLQQTNPFSFGASQVADNVTDEKKMEELKSHLPPSRFRANIAMVNPFLVDQEADYVSTDTVHGSCASIPEGLTPDIVQEAYESHDTGAPKLGYEPKIDLVQTAAKASQESVSPSVQNVALFEDADSVSSPVLPDIVMEAPVTSAPAGLDALAPQPDVSPVGHITPVEKMKFESEKPPSYEEAINKASAKEQEHVPVNVEPVKEAPIEEPGTPYISIACDLVKETIPEQVAADFSKALKSEFDSQFYSHFEESSPESEHSEPSYKLWEAEVIPKETATSVFSGRSVTPEKEELSETKWKEPSPTKSYLESSQPKSYENVVAEEPVVQKSKPDKLLQMEDFGKADYSNDFEVPSTIAPIKERSTPHKEEPIDVKEPKWQEDQVPKEQPKVKEDVSVKEKAKESSDKVVDLSNKAGSGPSINDEPVSKPVVPAKEPSVVPPASKEKKETSPATIPLASSNFQNTVVDLLYWRDIKKSGAVFGVSLFLLLSLTVFSIVSVAAYIALALLSVSISFRIYKGVLQAIQKSDDGHPFKAFLDSNIAVSEDVVQKYCNVALSHINCTIKELRRLFLVEDLVDSLKFAVLMWVFTYIGALFNGLTLLILALISLFSIPVIYERHQTQIDHYLSLVNKNVKNISDLVLSKIPGLKRKAD